jgi:ankyrin repeat protein
MNALDLYTKRQALNHALVRGNKRCVLELLERGIETLNDIDESTGFKPIHFAVYSGNLEIVELLIRKGAKITCTTTKQRWNPFHLAAYYGHFDIIKV